MKKTLMTATLILGMAVSGLCQGGGLFERGEMADAGIRNNKTPMLPAAHGSGEDQSATPLGGGVLVLGALGAAYLLGKKRREE